MKTTFLVISALFLFIQTYSTSSSNIIITASSNITCIQRERQSLLLFRKGLTDESNRLSTWTGVECCEWQGVGCDRRNGHVVTLDLRSPLSFINEHTLNTSNWLQGKGNQIQATVKQHLIGHFDPQLKEDDVVVLSKFGVGAAKGDNFPVVKHDYKVVFYHCTIVKSEVDCQGFPYGFDIIPLKNIVENKPIEKHTVDVMGCVKWCGDMDVYNSKAKETKKISFDLQDLDGTILKCTLWDKYAQQFHNFISVNQCDGPVVAIVHHGKCKEWKREISVQNVKYGTCVFVNEDWDIMNDFRNRFIDQQGESSTSHSKLSSQVCNKVYNEFVVNNTKRFVDEIMDLPKGSAFVLLATIKIVEEEFGWFYTGCRNCNKMVVSKSKYLEVVGEDIESVEKAAPETMWCTKYKCEATSIIPRFKVQVRVQDGTGSVSLVLFERDVHRLVGLFSNDIRERQLKAEETDKFSYELNRMLNKLVAFKIEIDDYNTTNTYHVYNVQRTTDDPIVINELSKSTCDTNDESIQEPCELESVKLDDSSQFVKQESSSKDVVSGYANSSMIELEKDYANSPNGKRPINEPANEVGGELSTTSKRTRKMSYKLKN